MAPNNTFLTDQEFKIVKDNAPWVISHLKKDNQKVVHELRHYLWENRELEAYYILAKYDHTNNQ